MSIIRFKAPDIVYVDYDPVADSAYIKLRDGKVHKTREYIEGKSPNIMLDFDVKGHLLGIELLCVNEAHKKPSPDAVFGKLSQRYHVPALRHINARAITGLCI